MESLVLLVSIIVMTTIISGPAALILAKYRFNILAIVFSFIACLSGLNILLNVVTSFRMVGAVAIGLGIYSLVIVYENITSSQAD